MNAYEKYTPLRIILPFVLGIVAGINLAEKISPAPVLIVAFTGLCLMAGAYIFLKTDYRFRWTGGFFALVSLFFAGVFAVIYANGKYQRFPETKNSAVLNATVYLCKMIENPVEKSFALKGNAIVVAYADSLGCWQPAKMKVMLYFRGDSMSTYPQYGEKLLARCKLQHIAKPANPDMFNYQKYLGNQHIYCQAFVEKGEWQLLEGNYGNLLKRGAEYCRLELMQILKSFGLPGTELALASALIIGVKDHLENETRLAFSHAGAMHVLCVSGLHVGILFAIADKLLIFLRRNRKGRIVQKILTILIIWLYAFVTGLSPSVTRASLMFSFIAAGRLVKRGTENYNILAIAAFTQLLVDPYEITAVGFQLSYLAVLGIFAFYKPFETLLASNNRIASWVWSLVSVSTAAQLATFPLAAFYFKLFPVYFLLTNLIVVPLAGFILYYAVILLTAGALGIAWQWLSWPFIWMLRLMNGSVELIQSWPGAVIEPVILNEVQVLLMYVLIMSIFVFGVLARRRWVFILISSLIGLSLSFSFIRYGRLQERELVVYHVAGSTAIDLIYKRKVFFICDSNVVSDSRKIDYNIKPHRWQQGGREVVILPTETDTVISSHGLNYQYPFVFFNGKKILLIDEDWRRKILNDSVKADLLIFRGKVYLEPEQLGLLNNAETVIFDSSVPVYLADKYTKLMSREGRECHYLPADGAYIKKW